MPPIVPRETSAARSDWIVRAGAGAALLAAAIGIGVLALGKGRGRGGAEVPASATSSGAAAGSVAPTAATRTAGLLAGTGPSLFAPPRKIGLGGFPRGDAAAIANAGARRPASLSEGMDELRAALLSQDFDRIGYAEARLRSYLGGDEARALELLELFRRESDPALLSVIAGVLASDPAAARSAALAAALASIAEDASAPQDRRQQALAILAQSSADVPDLERRLAALARGDDPDFRQAAIAALASRAGALPPGARRDEALAALLRACRGEPAPEIRAAFIAGVSLRDAPEGAVRDVQEAMAQDPSPGVREAAAHALGDAGGPSRAGASTALEEAFRGEADPGARRAMLISLVRLLGPGAAGPIARLRPVAGATQVDCEDYLEILASGETQADRVFEQKVAREAARGQAPGGDGAHHHD